MTFRLSLSPQILTICALFFFSMLGVMILSSAPTLDENLTPALAEEVNATIPFRDPVQLGWQGVMLSVGGIGVIAALGLLVRRLRGRR